MEHTVPNLNEQEVQQHEDWRLENWSLMATGDCYTASELRSRSLHGQVYNHPNFPAGHWILTTSVLRIEEGRVVTKSGSRYVLGQPGSQYEALFPGARGRLLANV